MNPAKTRLISIPYPAQIILADRPPKKELPSGSRLWLDAKTGWVYCHNGKRWVREKTKHFPLFYPINSLETNKEAIELWLGRDAAKAIYWKDSD